MLLALAIAGAGLAGCIEAPGFLNVQNDEVTAQERLELADEAAKAWSEDAELASVMTIESTTPTDERVPMDPEVGNGRALAWWYVYCLQTGETLEARAYKVTADGVVTEEKDAAMLAGQPGLHQMGAVGDWKVDSDEAIEVAKTNESFRLAAQGFNATVLQGLANHEGVSSWWLVAGSVDGIVVASVDAVAGTLLDVKIVDMGLAMPQINFAAQGPEAFVPEPVHLEGEGTLEGEEPLEFPFTVASLMEGTLEIESAGGDFTRGARWAILDAEGQEIDGGMTRGTLAGEEQAESYDVKIETPGEYTLVFEPMGFTPGAVSLPTSDDVRVAFVMDLVPPGMGHEEHEEDDS